MRLKHIVTLSVLIAWVILLVICSSPAQAASAGELVPEQVTVTAYCLTGITYTGIAVRPGAIAATWDIPAYTQYYIPGYGFGTVLDRGLLGVKQLDVWVESCHFALHTWGRRSLTVWRFV